MLPTQDNQTTRTRRPNGFTEAVRKELGPKVKVSKTHISAVGKGQRTNDAVLLAIITVDHNWQALERERLKKLIF